VVVLRFIINQTINWWRISAETERGNNMFNSPKLSDDFWKFVKELRHINRHFVTNPIAEKLESLVLDCSNYSDVSVKDKLYRVRICSGEEDFIKDRGVINGVFNVNEPPGSVVGDKRGKFAGFDKKRCGAPPINLCGEGRANGKSIRRLYVAETPQTAIYEVRPYLGSVVSIAKLKVNAPFKVLDLTKEKKNDEEMERLRGYVGEQFSQTCAGDSDGYSFSQWFSDLVDAKGKDLRGIKYPSAMHRGGKNLVVFGLHGEKDLNSDSYFGIEAVGSEVYYINNIFYDLKQLKPLRNDVFGLERPWELDC